MLIRTASTLTTWIVFKEVAILWSSCTHVMQLAGWITGIDNVLQGISSRDVLSLMCSMVLKICHILHFGMGTTVTLVIGMHVLCGREGT